MRIAFTATLLLSFYFTAKSQDQLPIDPSIGKYELTEVIEMKASKDVLFKNAQRWVAKSFSDAKSAVQLEDKEAGKIIMTGKGPYTLFLGNETTGREYAYTLTIDCKDNKYRYKIENVRVPQGSDEPTPIEKYNEWSREAGIKLKDEQDKYDALPDKRKKGIKGDLAYLDLKYAKATTLTYNSLIRSVKEMIPSVIASLKKGMADNDDF